jgi:hypothetical protein
MILVMFLHIVSPNLAFEDAELNTSERKALRAWGSSLLGVRRAAMANILSNTRKSLDT